MDPRLFRTLGGSGVRSEINVTPLVDVCLVLLIIFMVVTPMLGVGAAVLPTTENPERMGDARDEIALTLEQDGRIAVGKRALTARELAGALRDERTRAPARPLVIKADRRLRYSAVREAMRAASEGGYQRAGLAVQRRDKSTSPRGAAWR